MPQQQSNDKRADITLVTGQSESGKTAYTKSRIAKIPRVLAFDVKGDYANLPGFIVVERAADLVRVLQAGQHRRVTYVPKPSGLPDRFDFWCKCAYAWGNCAVIAEELADVTTPGKAPEGWGWVIRRGRDRNLVVFGITQRPSESDKTILGNVTKIHCCTMGRSDDRKYMAKELDVTQATLNGLNLDKLEWIEKDFRTRKITLGSLKTTRVTPYTGGPFST